jgi:hypothetical protein
MNKPIIGMIHLPPLPGSFNYQGASLEAIKEYALSDAQKLAEAQFDGFLLQNANDRPPSLEICPEKVAYMSVIGAAIHQKYPQIPIGVSVTWEVPKAAIAVAHAIGGSFVRLQHVYTGVAVTPYGLVQGCCYEATQFLKYLDAQNIRILADIYNPYIVPLGGLSIPELALFALINGQANVLVVTGRTLEDTEETIKAIKKLSPQAKIYSGGGCTPENIKKVLEFADGVIVGRALKEGGRVWDPINLDKAKRFMEEVFKARQG